jgi:hypothetical protein
VFYLNLYYDARKHKIKTLTFVTLLKDNHRAQCNSPDNLTKVAHYKNTGSRELIPFNPSM